MGYALADAAQNAGHEVVLVTGPVSIDAPSGCEVHPIETTGELQSACLELFPQCDGVIAAAAVCDYRPLERITGKISKTGEPVTFELVETADVLAELGSQKKHRWVIGFALESQDPRENAMRKLKMKKCDYIILNNTRAISSLLNDIEVLDPEGQIIKAMSGTKIEIAERLIGWLTQRFAN